MLLGLCWRRQGRIWIRVPLTGLIARAAYRLAQKAAGSRRRARPASPSRPALRLRPGTPAALRPARRRSAEHTSELQYLQRTQDAVIWLKTKSNNTNPIL